MGHSEGFGVEEGSGEGVVIGVDVLVGSAVEFEGEVGCGVMGGGVDVGWGVGVTVGIGVETGAGVEGKGVVTPVVVDV